MARKVVKKSVQTKEKNLTLVYVGPSKVGGILSRFRIYKNGIPDTVLQSVENKNALKKLFVSPSELGSAILNIKVKGHPLNIYYKTIEKEFSKEDK